MPEKNTIFVLETEDTKTLPPEKNKQYKINQNGKLF